jgi:hypothetical protein
MPTDSNLSDKEELTRSRISFVASGALLIIFAVSYGYLDYYYIQDPVQGKTENLTVREGSHRVATPLIGGLYSYHIFPMMVIFILVGFTPFFDSVSFNILGRHRRRKTLSLGIAGVLAALVAEDFSWFFYRWWLPIDTDAQKGLLMQALDWSVKTLGGIQLHGMSALHTFVIPYWYLIALLLAGLAYYYAFRSPRRKR